MVHQTMDKLLNLEFINGKLTNPHSTTPTTQRENTQDQDASFLILEIQKGFRSLMNQPTKLYLQSPPANNSSTARRTAPATAVGLPIALGLPQRIREAGVSRSSVRLPSPLERPFIRIATKFRTLQPQPPFLGVLQ